MAKILRGADVTAALNERILAAVKDLKDQGVVPSLAIIRMGEREDDISYEKNAMKRCAKLGVEAKRILLPWSVKQEELMSVIEGVNRDREIHGVLMFRPMPPQINADAVQRALAPEKDVDGLTDTSLAGLFTGDNRGYPPCTAQAVVEILDYMGADCTGKKAVVVGRSLVVGKPVSMLLLGRNATVTICHTHTEDLPAVCRAADILIAAARKPQMVDRRYLSPGQIVIDVGIFVDENGHLCGAVNTADAEEIAAAVTPVPGGVGPVTTSVLVSHVVESARRQTERTLRQFHAFVPE